MNGWHFVSSTSWDEFKSPLPRYVMNAYMVTVEEILPIALDLMADEGMVVVDMRSTAREEPPETAHIRMSRMTLM